MTREEFFNHIRNDFFNALTIDLEDFKAMAKDVLPIFGDLEIIITEKEGNERLLTLIDKHIVKVLNDNTDILEQVDMSSKSIELYLDSENIITIVNNHGYSMLNKTNKSNVLFVASLIGKKINF